MNFSFAFVFILTTLAVFGGCQQITSSNIDSLLGDRQFVKKQIGCVLGKSRCDAFGRQIRASIPKVLHDNCNTCTPEEAQTAEKIVNFVKTNHPQIWQKIVKKYSKNN